MRAPWNRAPIGWAGRFMRDPSGPFMNIIAVRPVSASTVFRGEREMSGRARSSLSTGSKPVHLSLRDVSTIDQGGSAWNPMVSDVHHMEAR